MKFDLILATVGRSKKVKQLLVSLTHQTYKNFRLIVVDQNADDRVKDIVEEFSEIFSITYMRCEKGLSKARNLGLTKASGDIIAFPDDDCEYPPKLLEQIVSLFSQNPQWDGLTGRSVDQSGNESAGNFSKDAGYLTIKNLWNRNISFTIFLKYKIVSKIGEFDEDLGLGAKTKFQSGEETDYLIRALKSEFSIFYSPQIKVFHPNPIENYSAKSLARAYSYGCGWGHVLKKHHFPIPFKTLSLVKPFGGALISLATLRLKKARYHLNVFRGRLEGTFL